MKDHGLIYMLNYNIMWENIKFIGIILLIFFGGFGAAQWLLWDVYYYEGQKDALRGKQKYTMEIRYKLSVIDSVVPRINRTYCECVGDDIYVYFDKHDSVVRKTKYIPVDTVFIKK